MVWIHYLTKLAMQSGVNPTISTVRKNITSLMFALTTFTPYLLFRYKCKMQNCYNACKSNKMDDYHTIAYLALSECRIGVFSVSRDTQKLGMLPPDTTCVKLIIDSVTRT